MAVDGSLKVGDVAHDLIKRGKVIVVEKAAATVEDYRRFEDFDLVEYQSHPLLDVTDEETVWTCVYLPDEPKVDFSGTYDFPESRLARIPVEEVNDDIQRPQRASTVLTLSLVFDSMQRYEAIDEDDIHAVADHIGDDIYRDYIDEALEVARVENHFEDTEADSDDLGDFERGDN